MPASSDPARLRLLLLTATRLLGALLIAGGALAVMLARGDRTLAVLGGVLMLGGLANLWLVPRALLRAWRAGEPR